MREGPVDVFLEMLRDEIVMALETVLGAALDQALEDALERRTWHCCAVHEWAAQSAGPTSTA